jgi:outer membrane beta-barrel protein
MIRSSLLYLALGASCILAPAAFAADQDVDDTGKVEAIQNRTFKMAQEIEVAVGFLPWDAFYKGVTAEGSYTLHFSDAIAWEIARFGYSVNFDTGLKNQLLNLGVQPTAFSEVQLFASSSIIWSPIYFKAAFSNTSVAHGEFYFLAGGGAFDLKTGNSSSFQPSVNAGLGVRFFLTQVLSLRFEGRENLLIASSLTSVIDLTFGVGFNFGASD